MVKKLPTQMKLAFLELNQTDLNVLKKKCRETDTCLGVSQLCSLALNGTLPSAIKWFDWNGQSLLVKYWTISLSFEL